MFEEKKRYKTSEAVKLLQSQGYTWLPVSQVWSKRKGLPIDELPAGNPGWYRRCQEKGGSLSWDGYACVDRGGKVSYFDLELRPQVWSPSPGYRDRIVFVEVSILDEIRLKETS